MQCWSCSVNAFVCILKPRLVHFGQSLLRPPPCTVAQYTVQSCANCAFTQRQRHNIQFAHHKPHSAHFDYKSLRRCANALQVELLEFSNLASSGEMFPYHWVEVKCILCNTSIRCNVCTKIWYGGDAVDTVIFEARFAAAAAYSVLRGASSRASHISSKGSHHLGKLVF